MNFQESCFYYKTPTFNWKIDSRLILSSNLRSTDRGASLEVVHVVEKKTKLRIEKLQCQATESECHEIHKDLEPTLKVTSRPNEVRDRLLNINLNTFDGVVAVGGDGIYNEVLSALLDREMRNSGLDPNDPDSRLVPIKLPVGIIPAGSGNYTAWYLNGTKCPKTAAIRIVLGDCVATNIASLHQGNKCSGYSSLILGFGLFGDVMRDCEKYRWMGTSRFKVIPVGTVLSRRPVNVIISYISAKSGNNNSKINNRATTLKQEFHRQISVPAFNTKKARVNFQKRTVSSSDTFGASSEWKTAEDRVVYAVDTYPITMKPNGTKMVPHFADDSLKLIITQKCKLMDHIRQLKEVDDGKSTCYDFNFVRTINVQRYRVRILKNETQDFFVNCDGEVICLDGPEFDVSLHKQVVKLYGKLN
ncbi:ceramide kinase-like [Saccostrea echinata]|uniref:ceramide kinase-like n=1 Tax=Saccostrea echinata TaxID=191078 RepID=UPI002A804367|nr:ceramide kinase-like [Saccostrea echinata]